MEYVYLVFSCTPYRIGKMIRHFTKEPYNHISIALDEDLTRMYSFARRHHCTPFYGGFVRESLSRYCINNVPANISVCKLSVTKERFVWLEATLTEMENNKEYYLYNHISAACAMMHRTARRKDAYTCVEFCVSLLQELGFSVDPAQYYTVGDLETMFFKDNIYLGPIPTAKEIDTNYYKSVKHPTVVTISSFLSLMQRPKV